MTVLQSIFLSVCNDFSAQKERLLVEEEDPRDPRNIIYCGYCANHYKKMVNQYGVLVSMCRIVMFMGIALLTVNSCVELITDQAEDEAESS